jgi:KDO2-lipid IV(A) lauroyltransferase
LALFPLALARSIGRGIGWLAYLTIGKLRRRVEETMTAALPEMIRLNPELNGVTVPELAWRFYANLGMFFLEVVKIYFGLGQRLLEQVEFRGLEHFIQAKDAGRGVILITAHAGNWEAMALAFGLKYHPTTIVVRHQRSPKVTELLAALRNRFGNDTILKDGAARKVLSVIRKGGVVGILSDIAVPEREGILTSFLGRPAWTTPMPAVIAQKTGCTLLSGLIHRAGERLIVEFLPIATEGLDTEAITNSISKRIEQHIARHPDEWFWFYRRWKGAPASPMVTD